MLNVQSIIGQDYTQTKAEQKLSNAIQRANRENKNLMLMFKASWCGLCKKLNNTISNPSIKSFFETNYIIEQLVVFESKKNKHLEDEGADKILAQFDGSESGLPYWVILDNKGRLLANSKLGKESKTKILIGQFGNIGCPANPEEIESFVYKLKRTSALTNSNLKEIASNFGK